MLASDLRLGNLVETDNSTIHFKDYVYVDLQVLEET